jgi:hypothetical protein
MKKMLMMVITGFLACPVGVFAQQRVCEMERISLIRVPIPATVRMPASFLGPQNIAVDEKGNIYAGFSIWQGATERPETTSSVPYVIRYDPISKGSQMFPMPEFLSKGAGIKQITSIAYRDDRVYTTALWRDREWQGGILAFNSAGKLERAINLDRFYPYKVSPAQGGAIYVLGVPKEDVRSGSAMILKLSPSGEITASFSPTVGMAREENLDSRQSIIHSDLLVDEAGRLIHVLPNGEVRFFNSNGALMNVLRKDGIGQATSSFWDGKNLVMRRVDLESKRTFIVFLDEQGQFLCEAETTGQLPPMIKGADGYYYGVGQLSVPDNAPVVQFEFLVAKFRATRQ